MAAWGSPEEVERRRRIRLSIWAYAYEFLEQPIVDDATFDHEAYAVDLSISTGHPKLDRWFKRNFLPYTGQWVTTHPELKKLRARTEWVLTHRPLPVTPTLR